MSPDQEKRLRELRETAQKLIAADYFVALSVARTASPEDVKKAFVEAAKAWHPDRVPAGMEEARPLFAKLFARLELARATLSDPARRSKYIEDLSKPVTAATAGDISSAEATLEFR
jgi:curved DNA-binding protein CbpA